MGKNYGGTQGLKWNLKIGLFLGLCLLEDWVGVLGLITYLQRYAHILVFIAKLEELSK